MGATDLPPSREVGVVKRRYPKVSSDLEWREVDPRHWVLFKDGKPFDGDLEDFETC
jgi:hypothetical protein